MWRQLPASVGLSDISMHCGSRVSEKGVCVNGQEDKQGHNAEADFSYRKGAT